MGVNHLLTHYIEVQLVTFSNSIVLHAQYTLQYEKLKAEMLGPPPALDSPGNLVATPLHLHVHCCFIATNKCITMIV